MTKHKNDDLNDKQEISQYFKINKRKRTPIRFIEPSLTQQQFTQEANINNIMRKYQLTGELPPQRIGYYADITNMPDFKTALNTVRDTQERFNALPSKLRQELNNDPQQMLNWIQDPNNLERAKQLGLVGDDTPIIRAEMPVKETKAVDTHTEKMIVVPEKA